jgi:4-amino-4-deoxy-L-arabinose transferase-like glycosyltransferase
MPLTIAVAIIFESEPLSSAWADRMTPTGIISRVKLGVRSVAFVVLLISILSAPRLLGINQFATIDEPYWLTAGSDFYYALSQRAFADTVYDYHPAVTTMWIVTAGMLMYFPQYRGMGQGYFDVYKDSLDNFLLAHGRTPLGLLTAARIMQAVLIVALLLVVFWMLNKLLGSKVAIVGTLLVSFDPFFLGHSRLLNHEGLMSLLVVVSLLSMLAYLLVDRKPIYLLASGVAAAAAQLTKSSAIVLLPVVGTLFALDVLLRRKENWKLSLRVDLGALATWMAVLCLVYVLLWPGMWVAPGIMLHEVFGNALSYATEGARISAAGSTAPATFQPGLADIVLYVQSVLWRTTPVVWLGCALSLLWLPRQPRIPRIGLLFLVLIGALFILLFGLASGRNSAHYVLTSYVAMDILAGAGFVALADWLGSRDIRAGRHVVSLVIPGIAVAVQAASALAHYPYYYTYYNPIMEAREPGLQDPNFGYGEGLDLAAAYLRQMPGAANSTVMAFYGHGPFSYFYPGTTEPLKTVYADEENVPQLQQILRRCDYLVIYYALEKGRDSPANVMRALQGATPEKSIWLNGIEYIRIYSMKAMSPDFLERLWP